MSARTRRFDGDAIIAEGGRMRMRLAGAGAALALIAAVTGCDSAPNTAAGAGAGAQSTATPDPCTLLTVAQLQQALGVALQRDPTPLASDQGYQRCAYADDKLHDVFVDVYPSGQVYDNLKEAARDADLNPVDVPGVALGAFRTTNAHMVVKMKGYAFSVIAAGFTSGDALDKAVEQLGRQAASAAA